jgi:hypothetical protein
MARSVEKYRRKDPNITVLWTAPLAHRQLRGSASAAQRRDNADPHKHGLTRADGPLAASVLTTTSIHTHVPERQDIRRIANLARFELQPDEQRRMLGQINGFFGIVEQCSAVDTDRRRCRMAHAASTPWSRQ